MPTTVEVSLGDRSYSVHIGAGLLDKLDSLFPNTIKGKNCAVITDSNVSPLYLDTVTRALKNTGFTVTPVTVPAGEQSKSMTVVEEVCAAMTSARLDRSSFVVALGGGVIGDLAGFAAAIYYRGIPFIQIPTTIVAQVDSAVGGKTGVNTPAGKNLLGCFHQPIAVIADVATLQTLPEREFNEGFAEVIKHGIIRDPELLDTVCNLSPNRTTLTPVIARNVAIKAAIVAADEEERSGTRALLNFGHTIGHGIENAAGYGKLLHGEAISLGIVAAAQLSLKKAGLPKSDYDKIIACLHAFSLPITLPPTIPTELIIDSLLADKKFAGGQIRFVLTSGIGSAFVSSDITLEDIRSAIETLRPTS